MSHKMFCLSCNRGTEYSQAKPRFCSFCGKPYISTTYQSNTNQINPEPLKPKVQFDINKNSPINIGGGSIVPRVNKDAISISEIGRNRSTMGQVLEEAALSGKDQTINIKPLIKARGRPKKAKVIEMTDSQREKNAKDFESNVFSKLLASKRGKNLESQDISISEGDNE